MATDAGIRVLLVEDEALLALDIEDMLAGLGYVVVGPIATVEKALQALAEQSVSVALLDINLGAGKTSYPIATALARRGIPFAFLSGYDERGIDEAFRGKPVLGKPIVEAKLGETLRGLCSPSPAKAAPGSEKAT